MRTDTKSWRVLDLFFSSAAVSVRQGANLLIKKQMQNLFHKVNRKFFRSKLLQAKTADNRNFHVRYFQALGKVSSAFALTILTLQRIFIFIVFF